MSQIDKRIQINKIVENQLPEFIRVDFPNAVELFKQYYNSLEYQSGSVDLLSNFDQYIKVDNLVPEVVVGITSITSDIETSDKIINVTTTKGFPDEYGLLKINDEIISYKGKTDTSFTECIRGFSGITGYNVGISSSLLDVNKEKLKFEETTASTHKSGATVTNLSVLFLQEFFRKLKKTFLPGFEENEFAKDLDIGNFVKFARSFYQSKGIEESIKILLRVLYGVDSKILDLENNLIKPSSAEFIRREVIVADLVTVNGQPKNLVGQTIFKSNDSNTNGSVSEVEIFTRSGKTYYKISLFVGFSDRDLIEGVFTIPGHTKSVDNVISGSDIVTVDSTIGFGATGTFISGDNKVNYTSKSINQFFGCSGIVNPINKTDGIRLNETIFGYENGDLSKRVDLRITGVLSDLIPISDINLVNEGDEVFVKNVGEKIFNPELTEASYKQIFANSWRYNTNSRFQADLESGSFKLKTSFDKSSINIDDEFEVLKRNEQNLVDNFGNSNFFVANTVPKDKLVSPSSLSNLIPDGSYDIRRRQKKANSTGVEIQKGNNKILSDVLNVYTDKDVDGYVASNSLPSYNIELNIINHVFTGAENIINGANNPAFDTPSTLIAGRFNYLKFPLGSTESIKFTQGDAVIYQPTEESIVGLESGRLYYVDPQPEVGVTNITRIALYNSRGQIGSASNIQVGFGTTSTGEHRFVLQRHANKKLDANHILKKIPLSQNLFVSTKNEQPVNDIGILIDGVQIQSPVSEDKIYYGPLESIQVDNKGEDYDVVNPPKLIVDSGIGNGALIEPSISGSVKKIFVDPQDFDIDSITSISLIGGNGNGCALEPILGSRFRELSFDSRNIKFGGGLDVDDETITFTTEHNLENGQKVFYRNLGNPSLGIGDAFVVGDVSTGTLSDGDPYFVRVVNPTTVRIFNQKSDSLFGIAGINTIGISTDTRVSGVHKFRTETKNTLLDIRVVNEGSGYQHRKLRVNPAGISTSYDTINFDNHGFNHGDIVRYSPTVGLGSTVPRAIDGLSTTSSYYIMKINDQSFRLADAGIGGTDKSNFTRGRFVGLGSTGTGYQTFTYPEIKVNVEVSFGSSVTGTINLTPLVTGEITDVYLYDGGTDYGSKILNHQENPSITVQNGKDAAIKPIIDNGKIIDAIVTNQGREYNSIPDIQFTSTKGAGAIVRPVLLNGSIIDVVVINSGIGYDDNTKANVVSRGRNCKFTSRVRNLTLNDQRRFGDLHLVSRTDSLNFGVLGYSQKTAKELDIRDGALTFIEKSNGDFDELNDHSPIIGWAYDGNPIYGPFGHSKADDSVSGFTTIRSSYKLDISKVKNRPTGFSDGFFIEDFTFDGSGDLDTHNGRFAKTPEFPNGIYAYYATVEKNNATGKLQGSYPFFVGRTYRSPYVSDNDKLNQEFDFNNSNLIRNTYPYNVGEEFADNDFIIESYEDIRQISTIESITQGSIDSLQIFNGGSGYKIGDLTSFDEEGTNGSGFSAEVSEIVGIGISNIKTSLERFNNAIVTWNNPNQVQITNSPFLEIEQDESVSIVGLSTTILNLTDTFKVGVSTDSVGLAKSMIAQSNSAGIVTDIFVNRVPSNISIGGTVRIGTGADTEELKVLNVFNQNKVLRLLRQVGVAHTFGSNVDALNDNFTISVKTKKFDSKVNNVVFFNAPQSVGVGTSGTSTLVKYHIGEIVEDVDIPERSIYLPNHPFETGQKITLTKPTTDLDGTTLTNTEIDVSFTNSTDGSFQLPSSTDSSVDVFVIKKDENYIGICSTRVGVSTNDSLYFLQNGTSGIGSHLYSFKSNFTQVTCDVDKVLSTVTTKIGAANTTTHNLKNNDIVKINVVPNLSVGLGSKDPVFVDYIPAIEKLIVNPIQFEPVNVETNRLDLLDHGFKTGDKVYYSGSATGLSEGVYYVYRVSDRYLQLGETFIDVTSDPVNVVSFTANTGGSDQRIGLINPQLKIVKNSKLTFGISSTSLLGFDFKVFVDKELTNEYITSQDSDSFNITGFGTAGIGTNSTLTIDLSKSIPNKLYYGLSKGGFISTSDTDVINNNEILFVDSVYNGEYKISGVTSSTFNFSPKRPEFLEYFDTDCETIEYSTKSKDVVGSIKNFKILSKGSNYKKLPKFNSVVRKNEDGILLSTQGINANVKAISSTVGRIHKTRINDIGYEYSSDKTLNPEAFVPTIVNVDNLDVIDQILIDDGGSNYSSAPNLLVFNPVKNIIVDDISLLPIIPNQTISDVDIPSPITGLDSVQHKIIAINNSNGVGINSIEQSVFPNAGVVTAYLVTPINGFGIEPFAVGDEIFVEGISRVGEGGIGTNTGSVGNAVITGDGFNSENYNYQFFEVQEYFAGSTNQQSKVVFSLAGVTTNPGIGKTFQSGYATIVNKKNYPQLRPIQSRGVFEQNERLSVNGVKSDLRLVELRDDYIKIDGLTRIKLGDRIRGEISGISAEIISIKENKAKFDVDYANRKEIGWLDDIGKLNKDYQVTPDNDYYQNLSYTIKSTIEWDKLVNPVNRLVHPAGLKNFADTSVERNVAVGVNTIESVTSITLDIVDEEMRVDAINNFDFVSDFGVLENKSKNLQFKNKNLTDFTKCISNRVLIHDDISEEFSSVGFSANDTIIKELVNDFNNFLIQIIDPDTSDVQFTEVVTLTDEDDVILLEKSTDFTNEKLGDIKTEITSTNVKNLIFEPTEKFNRDHDLKILEIGFNSNLSGIGTNIIGNVNLTGVNSGIGSTHVGFTTTTIAEFPKTNFNGLHASIFVEDTITKDVNYNEVVVDYSGDTVNLSEIYIDKNNVNSGSIVGVVTAKFENDKIKLQIENDRINILESRSNIIGFGTTTTGVGDFRFLVSGQPSGTERSIRLESTYRTGTASPINYLTINKNIESSVKSLIRVSSGNTSAIHQIISIRDSDDVLTVQYPFVSIGSTTGIGTFGSEISGSDINLRFFPDAEFAGLVEVQSYNQIFYTENDFDNNPPSLTYGSAKQSTFLKVYDGLAGRRANKTKFDLKHEGIPVYTKTFDPTNTGILSATTGIFTIPNHFFNTNEELTYSFSSTFVGSASSALSVGSTINQAGLSTTIIPTTVFAKRISDDKFSLFPTLGDVSSGVALSFTGLGDGNAHKLTMNKKLSKTIIGLDGIVQQPITFTSISYALDGNINSTETQFKVSGIGSIQPTDVLKINDEFMKIEQVGFASEKTGVINDATNIALGISNIPVVKVQRGVLGVPASSHSNTDEVRVHRGSFNIVDSTVHFIDPPKGNTRQRRSESNLPFVRATFNGRTFLRQNYDTNMLFDDISDNFTGIGKTYSLRVGGANTSSGIQQGNGILFINGVFQTPKTSNNPGHNYEFIADTVAGVSTVQFTGINSENGLPIVSEFDINQNQIPRGGLIVSLGSTPGLGYAPLVGAKASLFKNASGTITSVVGIATTSGVNYGIVDASFDNITGLVTVTTDKVHGFSLDRPTTVQLRDLQFSVGGSTRVFQDHDRPLFLVGIVSERMLEIQADPHAQAHTYVSGGNVFKFFDDNTFGSGYRGGTVSIGVTDIAYKHQFVSAGIGSIKKGNFNGTEYTATNAVYESHSGDLVLTIPNHDLTTSDTVGIDTGGLIFKCSKDGFFSNHPYPRSLSITSNPNGDPIAGQIISINAVTTNTIKINVGSGGGGGTGANITATVGVGGTLAFNIVSGGTGYVNPELIIPEPTYENLPVVGVSRLGIGPTTDTGENLLLNVEVGTSSTNVGIGTTLFEINKFSIARPGHSFKVGDKFKPVGLVTAAHLSQPIQEFELEVIEIFRDRFSAWQFGEIDYIDSIQNFQDGLRVRFPLYFNGQILSFEKDVADADSQQIDLDAVLIIFINGVLQTPKVNYQFEGGSTLTFDTAPDEEDKVDIFFYKGTEGVDVEVKDIQQVVEVGDEFRLLRNDQITGASTITETNSLRSQTDNRILKDVLGADLIETNIYTGIGITENTTKPIRWEKQKVDIILNDVIVPKTRSVLEPQIYPTAKIIGDLSNTSGTSLSDPIFVDNVSSFFYEKDRYSTNDTTIDALISSGFIGVGAAATAIVSSASTISIDITDGGSGYLSAPSISIRPPIGSGTTTGIGSTAFATTTIQNGSVNDTSLTAVGFGYNQSNPPQVLIEEPTFQTEKIDGLTHSNVLGFTGIITGIQQTTRSSNNPSALRFFFTAVRKNNDGDILNLTSANSIKQGYPFLVTGTKVGSGVTSVLSTNAGGKVGIGTTFLDNIYVVEFAPHVDGASGVITAHCHTDSNSSISGINTEGQFDQTNLGITTQLGEINWGILFGSDLNRSSNPISINVKGLIVDAGLSTFPTIQRKSYVNSSMRGLRSTGAIRAFGL